MLNRGVVGASNGINVSITGENADDRVLHQTRAE